MSLDLPVIHIRNNHLTICPADNVNPLTGHRTENLTVTVSCRGDRPLTGHRKRRNTERRRASVGCPLTGHRNKCSVITQETNENGLLRGDSSRENKIVLRRPRTATNVESVIETVRGDSLLTESVHNSADQNLTTSDSRVNRRLDSVQSLDNITNLGATPLVEKIRAKSDRSLDYQRTSLNSRLSLCSSGSFMQLESVTVRCQQESLVKPCVSPNNGSSHVEIIHSDKSIAMETVPSRPRRSSINIERGTIPVLLRKSSTPIREYNTPSKYSVESLEPLPLESLSVESLENGTHFTSVQHSPNKAFKENVETSLMQTKAIIRSLSCRLKQSLRRSKSNLEGSIGAKFKETKASLNSVKLTPPSSPAKNSNNKQPKLYSNSSADNIFQNAVSNQSEKQWRRSFLRYPKSSSSRETTRKAYFNLLAPNKFTKNTSSIEDIIKGKESNKKFILHANSNLECSNKKEPTIVSSVTCLESSRRSSTVSFGEETSCDESLNRHSKCKLNAPELTIKRLEDKPSGMGTERNISRSDKYLSLLKITDSNKRDAKSTVSNNEIVSDNRSAVSSEESQNRAKPILKINIQRQNRVWKRPTKTRTITDTGSGSSDDNESSVATTTATTLKTGITADVTTSTTALTTTTTTTTTTKAEISAITRQSSSYYSNDEANIQTSNPESSSDRQQHLELRTFMRKDLDNSSTSIVTSHSVGIDTSGIDSTCGTGDTGASQHRSTANSEEIAVKYENVLGPTSNLHICEVSTPKHHVVGVSSNTTTPSEHSRSSFQHPPPMLDNGTTEVASKNVNISSKTPTFEMLLKEIVNHHHNNNHDHTLTEPP